MDAAAGKAAAAMPPPPPEPSTTASRRQAEVERLLGRIHTNLYAIVEDEVDRVLYLEQTWSKNEMVKRVVRYIYNAAKSPELLLLPWEQSSTKLVEHALQGYCASCSDRPWFFVVDLGQALASAAWEITRATGQARSGPDSQGPAVRFKQLRDRVIDAYEDALDEALMTKAVWDVATAAFPDRAVQSKVIKALVKNHAKSLEDCLADTRPMPDLEKVEQFTRRWMDSSMRQAWCSIEGGELLLSEGMVLRLFQGLTAPFGDSHTYSCIPPVLISNIGRPPSDWDFLAGAAKKVVGAWRAEQERHASSAAPPKRRRLKTRGEAEPALQPPPAAEVFGTGTVEVLDSDDDRATPVSGIVGGAVGSTARPTLGLGDASEIGGVKLEQDPPERHPECASGDDCVGRPTDFLVRHWLESMEGDVYCQSCWRGLRSLNASLEGTWEDGPHAGEPYKDTFKLGP